MADYFAMDSRQCAQELDSLRKIYEEYAAKGLKLDMSRGKPAPDQLDLWKACRRHAAFLPIFWAHSRMR